jgi:hypothetical protein
MTSLYFQESLFLRFILLAQQQELQNQRWGIVVLRLTDNKGDKHTFTLTHVNYIPKSPVNLLSTRVLSQQFTNKHGFDQQGTGISSVFDNHTLFWDHGKFSK